MISAACAGCISTSCAYLGQVLFQSLLTDLGLLWCCLIDFRQETLQLRPVTHQLVVDPVSFVQQGVNVGHSLCKKGQNIL